MQRWPRSHQGCPRGLYLIASGLGLVLMQRWPRSHQGCPRGLVYVTFFSDKKLLLAL